MEADTTGPGTRINHGYVQAQVRRSIRRAKKELARQLARIGVTVKGWEFRGAATALAQYRPLNPYPT